MHLWEIKHPYYCNEGNYYAPGQEQPYHRYESFDGFLFEWGDADLDMNLVFRWDWKKVVDDEDAPEEVRDRLMVFIMGQRKGLYQWCEIDVTEADEEAVRAYLMPRWEHLRRLWEGISDQGETVTISKQQYEGLYHDSALLGSLRANGVDNWEGYSEAVREINRDE